MPSLSGEKRGRKDSLGTGSGSSTRLYLIRHGEVANALGKKVYNGQFDIDLSSNGYKQMEDVAGFLSDKPVRAVYSSDLKRTVIGAGMIADKHNLKLVQKRDLREKDFGRWEGLTYDQVAERYPDEWQAWLTDPVISRPRGGETFIEVQKRVIPELDRIISSHPGEEIIILAHGGVNRIVLCHALGLDLRYIFRIEQGYAAINIIDFFEDTAYVKLMNYQIGVL